MAATPVLPTKPYTQLRDVFRKIEDEARRVLRDRDLSDKEIEDIGEVLKRPRSPDHED